MKFEIGIVGIAMAIAIAMAMAMKKIIYRL